MKFYKHIYKVTVVYKYDVLYFLNYKYFIKIVPREMMRQANGEDNITVSYMIFMGSRI